MWCITSVHYSIFVNVFWIDRNMKLSHYICVTCFNGLVGWKPLWGQYCYVWWGPYPCLCPLLGLILFPWFCVIVLALPVTRIIFIFFPSQRLLRRLVEATQRSVPWLTTVSFVSLCWVHKYWSVSVTCFLFYTHLEFVWSIRPLLMFMAPCNVNIFQYMSNKMQLHTVYLYLETAVHVSGGTSTHHQELSHCYRYLPLVAGSGKCVTTIRCCRYSCMCSWWWVELPLETCRAVSGYK